MLRYWQPFGGLGFTHSAGRQSCQSHYSTATWVLYISSRSPSNIPSSLSAVTHSDTVMVQNSAKGFSLRVTRSFSCVVSMPCM